MRLVIIMLAMMLCASCAGPQVTARADRLSAPEVIYIKPDVPSVPQDAVARCADHGNAIVAGRPATTEELWREIARLRLLHQACQERQDTTRDWLLRILGDLKHGV